MIDLRKHSSRHLETKLILPIPEGKPYARDIHYYIFSPAQLHVGPDMVSKEAMLRKFQTHGRYASPEITLEELLDPVNKSSPLMTLEGYVKERRQGSSSTSDEIIIHELQTLANSIRHDSRVSVEDCKQLVAESVKHPDNTYAELEQLILQWATDMEKLTTFFRAMKTDIGLVLDKENLVEIAFSWTDEAMSILIEKDALEMYLSLEPVFGKIGEAARKLLRLSRKEATYRREQNYESSMTGKHEYSAESISYRQGVLKKWTQSVLYLTPQISNGPKRVGQFLAGMAAAVAMTFATVAAIFAERIYLKNSIQWALIVIIAYVFKDRIKEGLRAFFNKVVPRMMADEISHFVSPRTGKRLCTSRVNMEFADIKKVPASIHELRKDKKNPFRDMLPPENVVHFTRYIDVFPDRDPGTQDSWINNLTLITRIRIDDWLKEMDDPTDLSWRVNGSEDEFEQQNHERVYHLHMIIEEKGIKDDVFNVDHHLIIMNKQGIVRIEKVYQSGESTVGVNGM